MFKDKRIFTKGIIWELLGIPLAYIIFRNWHGSIAYIILRIIGYYIYHKIWKHIDWGK